jgi:hypothetical protein
MPGRGFGVVLSDQSRSRTSFRKPYALSSLRRIDVSPEDPAKSWPSTDPFSRESLGIPPRLNEMNKLLSFMVALCSLCMPCVSRAAWLTAMITEISVVAVGAPNNMIVVSISAPTGCAQNAFVFGESDPFMKETYAMLLAAKLAGKAIKYDHVYCLSNGYARGNQYALAE